MGRAPSSLLNGRRVLEEEEEMQSDITGRLSLLSSLPSIDQSTTNKQQNLPSTSPTDEREHQGSIGTGAGWILFETLAQVQASNQVCLPICLPAAHPFVTALQSTVLANRLAADQTKGRNSRGEKGGQPSLGIHLHRLHRLHLFA
ncbi:hypothetical protein TWF481_010246 [Arthrobotrys musiformis]|uniref:Uncharacterized protein n=1 Tax=Arthrobotrys musiformis TaxID=47236 RepID=A0AAV9W086_9PEZI